MWSSKDVYYISDGTGILATSLGQSLICQFPEINFSEEKFPYIRTIKEAKKTLKYILERSAGRRPVLFSTIIDAKIRIIFDRPEVEFFDAYGGFLERLENCLEARAVREPGFSRHFDDVTMTKRVAAIHYSLEHDDGTKAREYDEADIVILGVSRSGKTPISVFLATHFGLKTANFPLTSEYLNQYRLPDSIRQNRKRAIGLSTSPEMLHSSREKRYPNSNYAKLSTCRDEIQQAQQLFMKHEVPVISTTGKSIEEAATQILQTLGISKKSVL